MSQSHHCHPSRTIPGCHGSRRRQGLQKEPDQPTPKQNVGRCLAIVCRRRGVPWRSTLRLMKEPHCARRPVVQRWRRYNLGRRNRGFGATRCQGRRAPMVPRTVGQIPHTFVWQAGLQLPRSQQLVQDTEGQSQGALGRRARRFNHAPFASARVPSGLATRACLYVDLPMRETCSWRQTACGRLRAYAVAGARVRPWPTLVVSPPAALLLRVRRGNKERKLQ